ncbi:LuxR C-terminal-related transcriptional regulator [Patulibacter sp. NPDC049589]|uniref:LuxR C-terminal-related transcriptional regulator n=1 Tax=Patulibacter sp. NPDC049589 TaxID=3154731 RepID=UPI0034156E28
MRDPEPVERTTWTSEFTTVERRAQSLLDRGSLGAGDGEAVAVRRELLRLVDELCDATPERPAVDDPAPWLARTSELLGRLVDFERDLGFRTLETIAETLDRVPQDGSPHALIDDAPAGLCRACGLDRAMVSRVQGSSWLPERLYVADVAHPTNLALAAFIRDLRIPMQEAEVEADLVRRRAPALVADPQADARTFRPLISVSGCVGYVVAPIVTGAGVVGLLHGDTFASGRPLTVSDLRNTQAFADGLGVRFERAVLARRAETHLESFRVASAQLDSTLARLANAPAGSDDSRAGVEARDARHGVERLTQRELEVLGLFASGRSIREVARLLVLSEATIKSHSKSIMRRLNTSNRAESVSRYVLDRRGRGT